MTAWIDGALADCELADFEREIAGDASHETERAEAQKLGAFLRAYGAVGAASPLTSGDFFNHQIMERISRESRGSANRELRPTHAQSGWRWPLAKLSLVGAFALCVAFTLFHFWIPVGPVTMPTASQYMAQVTEAQPGTAGIYVTSIHSKANDLTVLWLDGADYIPADSAISATTATH